MDWEKLVRFYLFWQSSQISPLSKPFFAFPSALMPGVQSAETDDKASDVPHDLKKSRNELRGDAGLVKLLRNAAEQTAQEDGWSHLGRVGQYISNNTSFSPINYGYKKLSDLIRVSELFHIDMRKNKSVMYIKDSRK